MKKIMTAIYTVCFIAILSGIASAFSDISISYTVNESTSMLLLGVGLFGVAGISRNIKNRLN